MNSATEEFIGSFKALLKRYNVKLEKGLSGFDDDYEPTWWFSNDVEWAKNEIYLTMDDIHKELANEN